VSPLKQPEIPPLFKADSATLSVCASKDRKVIVTYSGRDASKVVLEGQGVGTPMACRDGHLWASPP
jgi:hypothetical protein